MGRTAPEDHQHTVANSDHPSDRAHGDHDLERLPEPALALSDTPPKPAEKVVVRKLLQLLDNPRVSIALWDGTEIATDPEPAVRVTIHDRNALYRLAYKPTLSFGDLYVDGRISLDKPVETLLDTVYPRLIERDRTSGRGRSLLRSLLTKRARRNTLSGSKENIHQHYDLGNDFYELWLDRDYTQYTCAYFPTREATLEAAQAAKLDHVCRKLNLRAGESVVEAGSGWGGLARYMAKHYGVRVTSYNISHEQVRYAQERAVREGLDDRVTYVEDDYRNIRGEFDAFVSVGMLEHVGTANYRALGATIDRTLKSDGRGLIHSIGQTMPRPLNAWIESYIFPGAYPPTLREMATIFEPFGFAVNDVENLRPHYALTLTHWRERFDAHRKEIEQMFDERFARAWRLYLCGSISAFTTGQLQLFQLVFSRPDSPSIPWTRNHLYDGHREPGA